MKLYEIILELKEIYNDETYKDNYSYESLKKLNNLIVKLENEFNESKFINNINDKIRINILKSVLKKASECQKILGCYSKQSEYCVITDGKQAYFLKSDILPFDYAKSDIIDNEDEYIKKNNLNVIDGVYPNLLQFLNVNIEPERITFDVDWILKLEKITLSNSNKQKVYTFNDRIILDLCILKNIIKVLQLKNKIILEVYGEKAPILIRNDKDEIGLLLPILKF